MGGTPTIERPRLLEPLSAQAVAVLIAPGGFGKSTLAEQLIDRWNRAPVRIRLRTSTSPAALIDAVRRALRRAGWRDLADSLGDDEPEHAVDELVATLHATGAELTWFVDDVQLLDADAWHLLEGLATNLNDGSRAVFCGRSLPASTSLAARFGLTDANDLRMTNDEIARLVFCAVDAADVGPSERDTVQPVEPSLVADLALATTGWPAAVVIAAQRLRNDPSWSPTTRGAGSGLLARLIEPVLGEDRRLLVRLAQLPLLDQHVCELVAGPTAFERIARSALPSRVDQAGWTVLPDAVREALLTIGHPESKLEPEISLAAALHYASRGELPSALQFVHDQGDPEHIAIVLASRHWSELETAGFTELTQLIELIPDQLLARHASLLVIAARAAEAQRPLLRRAWLDRLEKISTVDQWPPIDPATTLAGEAERARDLVRSVRLHEAIDLATSIEARADPSEIVTRARARLAFGHAHAFLAQPESYDLAAKAFTEAAALFALAHESRWQSEALARLGYNVMFHRGEVAAGTERVELALALLPVGDRTRAFWLTNASEMFEWLGRQAEADAAVSEALEIGNRLRDPGVLAMGHWARAWLCGWRGNVLGVHSAQVEVEALHPGWLDSGTAVEFYGSLADHYLVLGDLPAAHAAARRARELGEQHDYRHAVDSMTARIEALVGDPLIALELLARIDGSAGGPPNSAWVRRLEGAVASLRAGDEAGARTRVAEAIASVSAMGLPDLPQRLEGPIVARLASVWPIASTDKHDDKTTISVLGTFGVRRGNQDVTPPAGHPSTLIKLLVLQGTMTVEAMIDALWPDADLVTGRARLRNTLNRLRDRSGPCVERRAEALKLSDDIQTDLSVFDRAVADCLTAEAATRIGLARTAIAMHAGPLLPGDVYEDWAAAPRQRVLRRYLTLVDLVAQSAITTQNYEEAARLLDLGIDADPLNHDRYVELVAVLQNQGRTGAARDVADRARVVFEEIGVSISPALQTLLDRSSPSQGPPRTHVGRPGANIAR